MATQSVNNNVPGIRDLMIRHYDFEAPQLVVKAAANEMETLLSGIGAVGDLLTDAADNTGSNIESHTLGDTGALLSTLAELAWQMQCLGANASHQLESANSGTPTAATPGTPRTDAVVSSTDQVQRETIFEARQRIFEAQGIAQMLKQQFIHAASTNPGAMSCCDAIDNLLQQAASGLEPLE